MTGNNSHVREVVLNTIADQLLRGIKKHLLGWSYCGAIRRGEDFVEDVELIIIPKRDKIATIVEKLNRRCKAVDISNNAIWVVNFATLDITLYLASRQSFVPLQIIKTGPESFIREFIATAKAKGYSLDETGFRRDDRIIIVEFESLIFEKIGIPYVKPQERAGARIPTIEAPEADEQIISRMEEII